jgi:hypothetical protein
MIVLCPINPCMLRCPLRPMPIWMGTYGGSCCLDHKLNKLWLEAKQSDLATDQESELRLCHGPARRSESHRETNPRSYSG